MSSARRFACVFREAKIAKWENLITSTTAKVTEAEAELAAVNAQITDIQTAIAAEQAICVDAILDVFKCAKIKGAPSGLNPVPTLWMKNIHRFINDRKNEQNRIK